MTSDLAAGPLSARRPGPQAADATSLDRMASTPMRPWQLVAIGLCVALTALDGFDVLSISFAAPGIAAEWGIARPALGVVLSLELFGMGAGSVLLGALGDRLGRRPVVLASLVAMGCGMAGAAMASSIAFLSVCRLLTGLGIGGVLALTTALVAEHANRRGRTTAVALMSAGYPLGAVLGGGVAAHLLAGHGWRVVFAFGAGVSVLLLPLVLLLLPETIAFLVERRPPHALARVNRLLVRSGLPPLATLPSRGTALHPGAPAGAGPLSRPLRRTTLALLAAYFLHMMTFYFILKWAPKIVVDLGYTAARAAVVLVWANVGGLAGAIGFSLLTSRIQLRPLVAAAMVVSAVAVALFGRVTQPLAMLAAAAAIAGFFTNGAIVGLYALLATRFPPAIRAGATGLVIGLGRTGAALSPIIVGQLFGLHLGLASVASIIAAGSLLAAGAILLLPRVPVIDPAF